ncbi:MAG: AAA family ATPase, partial [Thermodesulfobacteriota bacterium]|nr:AAA family ATPase [Thermodesulfobacteriota bacterium]
MNAFPAKFIIERGQVRTENSNKPHGFGLINPATFSPFPKNPVIARFFREIGRADELGSGVRKLMKYGRSYGGSDPELIEGDVFRMIVKYPDSQIYEEAPELRPASEAPVTPEVTGEVTGEVQKFLKKLHTPMGRLEAQNAINLKGQANFRDRYLKPALDLELVEMIIPDKPKSRLQKYRLTDTGKRLLESMQK